MADTTHRIYSQTPVTMLGTELNTLANGLNTAASTAFDNSTLLDLFMDLELNLAAQGSARTANAYIAVFLLPQFDGTNYADLNEITAEPVALFALPGTAAAARPAPERDIAIPPGLFKVFARNATGQALAASGSTVKIRTHSIKHT